MCVVLFLHSLGVIAIGGAEKKGFLFYESGERDLFPESHSIP